jgi:hypothetical protein
MMKRRAFVHGLASVPAVLLVQPALAASPKPAPPPVVVYHFVAPGCSDCERWDLRHLPRWLNSGEYRRTSYRRIEGRTVEEALDPRRWPAEVRPFAASLRQTPAFVVLNQGHRVAAASGEGAWTDVIWPAIKRAAA